jgi:Tol biopolymer transport system component
VQGSADAAGVYFGALGSDTVKRLVPADAAAVYLPSGYLLYVRQGALLARRFDQVRGELIGDPVTVADSVGVDSAFNAAALSTSATGIIALRAGSSARRQLTWFDRAGRMLGALGPPDEGSVLYPELSPDGRRVVVDRTVQTNRDVWVVDIGRAVPTRFTFDTAIDSLPIWSPDGARIVFRSNRKGPYDLYEVQATSAGAETPLLESAQTKFPNDWSPDGRFILYGTADPKSGGNQVWALALDAKTEPRSFPVVQTRFDSNYAQFSPDGRWVAYQSNESGRIEIYVQPFVAPTSSGSARAPSGKWQMSTAGGTWPRWRADGREIFYIALDGKLMAVPVQARESTLEAGAPAVLFQTQIANPGSSAFKNQYDVSRDGRFLINMSADEATTSTITIIQNWKPR